MAALAVVVATALHCAGTVEVKVRCADAVDYGWRHHATSLSRGRIAPNLQVTALSLDRDSTASGAATWKFGQRWKPRRDQREQHSALRACRGAMLIYIEKVYSDQGVVTREREKEKWDG